MAVHDLDFNTYKKKYNRVFEQVVSDIPEGIVFERRRVSPHLLSFQVLGITRMINDVLAVLL